MFENRRATAAIVGAVFVIVLLILAFANVSFPS